MAFVIVTMEVKLIFTISAVEGKVIVVIIVMKVEAILHHKDDGDGPGSAVALAAEHLPLTFHPQDVLHSVFVQRWKTQFIVTSHW